MKTRISEEGLWIFKNGLEKTEERKNGSREAKVGKQKYGKTKEAQRREERH
jgi:hypothetical protein